MKPIVPFDEDDRLKDLYTYNILDTEPEKEFQELVELIAQICDCPIAAITFIDRDRQWFKAKKGDTIPETIRDNSFCAYTILNQTPLIVEDATRDERFADNPDVTGGMQIRFYAGVPIVSSKLKRIGAVCIIDKKPRSITEGQIASLKLVTNQISHLLELRLRNTMLQEYSKESLRNSELAYDYLFNQANEPKWIYEYETLRILQVNQAAINLYGYSKAEFLQMHVHDMRTYEEKNKIHQLIQTIKRNNRPTSFETVHEKKNGSRISVAVTIQDIVYLGKAARIATVSNITETVLLRKDKDLADLKIKEAAKTAKQEERDYIGKELHDNITQILATIKLYLEMAGNYAEMKDDMIRRSKEVVLEAMQEVRNLSHTLVMPSQNSFNLTNAIEELQDTYLIADLFQMHVDQSSSFEAIPEDLKLNFFRIIQEQLHNISKHADATKVSLKMTANRNAVLSIKDNGKGFDTEKQKSGIGLRNIEKRVEYYNGTFQIISVPAKGTELIVEIPLDGHL